LVGKIEEYELILMFRVAVCCSCLKKHAKKFEENQGWIELENQEKDKMTAACLNDQSRLAKKVAEMTMSNVKHWECTPVSPTTMPVPAEWTPGQWTGEEEDSEEECRLGGEENDSLMFQYNEALSPLSEKVNVRNFTPLTFQLNTTWEEATQKEKEICIDKAMEGCKIVCEVIAPKAGDELLQSCVQLPDQEIENVSDELITLMQAHKNAPTRN
ncbi:Hypothetical predicted protein, partial [Paramuricea clavata]